MKVTKQGKYLIFSFEDGGCVKWDFEYSCAIGKSGRVVKDLRSQLSGISIYTIVHSCVDKNYGAYLMWLSRILTNKNITNIGTILNEQSRYRNVEQIFSSGLRVCAHSYLIGVNVGDIPKVMLRFFRDNNIELRDSFIKHCLDNKDLMIVAINMLNNDEFITLTAEDIVNLISEDLVTQYEGRGRRRISVSYFKLLIDKGYNAKALWKYLDRLYTFEGIENCHIIREIYDYTVMQEQISPKYDKYPRNILTTMRIVSRNYNRLKTEYDEKKFSELVKPEMEKSFGSYKFFYPRTTQDIKDEAVQMNNCVSSYIQRVINNECDILFLRNTNRPDESLVTIEVRNGKIVQAFQKYNTPCTQEQKNVIAMWDEWWNKRKEVS